MWESKQMDIVMVWSHCYDCVLVWGSSGVCSSVCTVYKDRWQRKTLGLCTWPCRGKGHYKISTKSYWPTALTWRYIVCTNGFITEPVCVWIYVWNVAQILVINVTVEEPGQWAGFGDALRLGVEPRSARESGDAAALTRSSRLNHYLNMHHDESKISSPTAFKS